MLTIKCAQHLPPDITVHGFAIFMGLVGALHSLHSFWHGSPWASGLTWPEERNGPSSIVVIVIAVFAGSAPAGVGGVALRQAPLPPFPGRPVEGRATPRPEFITGSSDRASVPLT